MNEEKIRTFSFERRPGFSRERIPPKRNFNFFSTSDDMYIYKVGCHNPGNIISLPMDSIHSKYYIVKVKETSRKDKTD